MRRVVLEKVCSVSSDFCQPLVDHRRDHLDISHVIARRLFGLMLTLDG